jgi:DNA-binding response OmpR family regulator
MKRRVLIVDDELETCTLIQRVVSAAGMDALTLTDSGQASGALAQCKFDLVFLDFHMPPPDGIELARELRQSRLNGTTPVVLVSDDQRPSALSIGFDAGASFFLYKPIEKEGVLKLVRATQGMVEGERRRVRRVPVRQRVVLTCGMESTEGETVDMSVSGVLVAARRTFPVGSIVQLKLHLSEGPPTARWGSIARITKHNQMGIDMHRLKPTDEDAVQEFLLPLIQHAR